MEKHKRRKAVKATKKKAAKKSPKKGRKGVRGKAISLDELLGNVRRRVKKVIDSGEDFGPMVTGRPRAESGSDHYIENRRDWKVTDE